MAAGSARSLLFGRRSGATSSILPGEEPGYRLTWLPDLLDSALTSVTVQRRTSHPPQMQLRGSRGGGHEGSIDAGVPVVSFLRLFQVLA